MDGKMKELLINMKNRKNMLERKNLMLETCLLDANQKLHEIHTEFRNKLEDLFSVIACLEVKKDKMAETIEQMNVEQKSHKKQLKLLCIYFVIWVGYGLALNTRN
ncbi:hypothetical protein Ancab_040425 [Ancistrocladus abbreviatus]